MFSLIGSLVVIVIVRLVRLWEHSRMRRNSNTDSLGAKRTLFRSHIRSSHVLRPLIATRLLILNVSTCSVVCRRHEYPTNGLTGDPGMVRLP